MLMLLSVAAPRLLTLTPAGDGLLLPGGSRVPELCLRKRLTGQSSRSCHIGRSIVLAAHGSFHESAARHPGGMLLWGWAALHGLARLALVLLVPLARLWWVDLTLTSGSLLAVCSVVASMEAGAAFAGA